MRDLLYVILLIGLPALAVMQYRWITALSEHEVEHTEGVLRLSALQVGNDLNQTLGQLRQQLEPIAVRRPFGRGEGPGLTAATEQDIIASAQWYLTRLTQDRGARALDLSHAYVRYLSRDLQVHLLDYSFASHRFESERTQPLPRPDSPPGVPPMQVLLGHDPRDLELRVIDTSLSGIPLGGDADDTSRTPLTYLVSVRLDSSFFRHVMDSLTARAFPRSEYTVALVERTPAGRQLFYSSVPGEAWDTADLQVALPTDRPLRGRGRTAQGAGVDQLPSNGPLLVLVKSVDGSIQVSLNSFRIRNLLISFGILLALAGAIVFLMVSNARAERLREQQTRFFAGISHELRTPLTVIRSASENLTDGIVRDPSKLVLYGRMIRRETDHLWEMVEQVLRYASASGGSGSLSSRTLVSMRRVVEEAVERSVVLAEEKGIELRLCEVQDRTVEGDEQALRSAVQNLIINAIKYGVSGRGVDVSLSGSDRNCVVRVRDFGHGIPREEQRSIFEPFYRGSAGVSSQERGNGLGLSLVRNIAKAHGGSVSVESTEGAGSTFSLTLPTESVQE